LNDVEVTIGNYCPEVGNIARRRTEGNRKYTSRMCTVA